MPKFDDQSARRISKTVRGWERRVRNKPPTRGRWFGRNQFRIYTCQLSEALTSGGEAAAVLLTGTTKASDSGDIIVKDMPASITSGKVIATGVICRIFKDPDVPLDANEYCLLLPFACETNPSGSGT